jgi:hypothetical protein
MEMTGHRLREILTKGDTRTVELLLAVLKLTWGAFLLLPFHSFVPPADGGPRLMFVLPEVAWGVWLSMLGGVQLVGLLHYFDRVRLVSAGLAVPMWVFIALSSFLSSRTSYGWPLLTVIAVTNIWLYLRLRRRY